MTDEEMAEEYAKPLDIKYGGSFVRTTEEVKQAFLAGLKAGRPQWHDLRRDPKNLPISEVNLDMYPDFIKPKIKPRTKVVAKVCFKGYKNPTPWEEILHYEDGKWLRLHDLQGTRGFFKELPNCEYVLAWCEIPTFDKE